MDKTLQQLITLVEKGSIEQRCAALLVIAALKVQNSEITKSLSAALNHPSPVLKDYALRYFEEVQTKSSVPLLLPFLNDPDKEIQERVIRFLSRAGEPVANALIKQATNESRLWQLNAARVLCAVGGRTARKGLLQLLIPGTDEFNKAVCDLMTPAIRQMDSKEQEMLFSEIDAFIANLDIKQHRPAVVSALRLLGQLGLPQARRWLFKFVASEHHVSLRSHALVALLHCLRQQALRREEHAKLFALLEETEFSEVTRLALELLDVHELPDDVRPILSRLLASPHADVQKFALRKMGDFSSPATVRTLLEQLGDPDYRRRDVAARSLRKIPEARNALIKDLLECHDASKAWSIAELLPSFEGKWRHDTLEALWKRFAEAVEAEDRIQTAFLNTLKQADRRYAYEKLATHGAHLVKVKKYKEAVAFLMPLKEFSESDAGVKFPLALAQLKLHSHTVVTHRQHPAVDLFTDLYRNSVFPLLETLKKEKNLSPEELFALGFGLAERSGEERSLGKDLLEHVAAKFPRNKVGKSAKNKLKLLAG
jgi:HEAT repeat protein